MSAEDERDCLHLVDIEPTLLMQAVPAHDPAEGRTGDCWRTCLACLLSATDPEHVPHFAELAGPVAKGGWEMMRLARLWLREHTPFDLAAVNLADAQASGYPYMLGVRSRTGPWRHTVIARGTEVIHDPSGVGGYTLADSDDVCVEVLVAPYEPEPDGMVREWAMHVIADLQAEVDYLKGHLDRWGIVVPPFDAATNSAHCPVVDP